MYTLPNGTISEIVNYSKTDVSPLIAIPISPNEDYDVIEKAVSYTHLRAHETRGNLVCRLLLEKKKKQVKEAHISIHRTTRCVVYFFFNDTATTEIYT